jgi:DNA-binding NarL/FixJ family response regulator
LDSEPKFQGPESVALVLRMSKTFANTAPSLPRVDLVRQPRIAVALEDEGDRDAVVALLAAGGLPVNAGAVALHRVDRLMVDPPDAVVFVADPARPEVLAALRLVRRSAPATRIVVVAAGDDPASLPARQALNTGADGFVPWPAVERSLGPAVHAVMAGLVCAPREVRRLLAKPTFSHREKEVLALLVDGLTNREIAGRLFLAESTVKSHLMSAFAKLGVRSRKDAAALLLDPEEGLAATSLPPSARGLSALGQRPGK